MKAEDFTIVNVCDPFGCDVRQAWKAVDLFAEQVCEGYNGIISVGLGELGDKVYSDLFPWPMRNLQWFSYGLGMLGMLFPSTHITSFYVSPDESPHGRPPKLPFY